MLMNVKNVYERLSKYQQVEIDGMSFPATPFDEEELGIFDDHYDTLIAPVIYSAGKYVPLNNTAAILQGKKMHVLFAGMVAKRKFNLTFKGYYANTGELGFRPIKPTDVMRNAADPEVCTDTWDFQFAADSDYWIGWKADNLTPIHIDKDCLVIPVAIANTSPSQVVEQIKFKVGDITHKPIVLDTMLTMADTKDRVPIMPIKSMIFSPRDTVHGEAYSAAAGTNHLALVGVTFGLGSFLAPFVQTSVAL